jgi:hypothetical protein
MKTKKNSLPVIVVPILKGQYLSDIPDLNPIPTNKIVNKKLPNLGATHGEINVEHHSIIIEPHVPVIKGKSRKHPGLLAVHKGIFKDDVLEYLESNVEPKKIICTPEAFIKKVAPAINDCSKFNLYEDFTLMLDECDHIITDVDYRSAITAPMDEFFKFINKFMISATPIAPSYHVFLEQGFEFIQIEPQYDYTKDLDVICTNNVAGAFREYTNNKSDVPLFIFVNSTDTILSFIKMLDIKKQSMVFCAEDSVKKLNDANFHNAYSDLYTTFGEYNFFTSRFFSAVDIELDFNPDVVMITDLFFAKHSILDPETEIVQICGRFRNGIGSITHITNINPELEFKTQIEAENYLDGSHTAYTQFMDYLTTKHDLDQGAKDTLTQALERVDHARFVTKTGELNYFMKDNYLNEERIKSYYKDIPSLKAAYEGKGYFNLNFKYQQFPLSDADRLKRVQTKEQKELFEVVAEQLEKLHQPIPTGVFRLFDNTQSEIADLRQKCPEIYDAFKVIGLEGLKQSGFRMSKIRKAVRSQQKQDSISNTEMIDVVYDEFNTNRNYSESGIKKKLTEIYLEFDVKFKPLASHISRYFNTKRTTLKDGEKAYSLNNRKFLTQSEIIAKSI